MKLTLKENINTKSFILRHSIILRAISLLTGREESLETEKDTYLMLGMIDMLVNEDIVEECNEDERTFNEIVENDLEPFFFNLIEKEEYNDLFNYCKGILKDFYNKMYDTQHSIIGVIDAFLTMIGSLSPEEKKETLIETAKIAEKALDRKTEKLQEGTKEVNNKLEQLIEQYKRQVIEEKEIKNDAE